MGKLSAEVAQQRPLWEQSKQLEEVHRAEVAEVNHTTLMFSMFSCFRYLVGLCHFSYWLFCAQACLLQLIM